MPRPAVLLALAACLLTAAPASAVVKNLVPLKDVLASQQLILVARVEAVQPDKPAVVLRFSESLKGKAPFKSFAVDLTGDAYAKKEKHTQVLLDRLAPGRKLVLFVDPVGDGYAAFGFVEGTWFQLRGTRDGGWSLLHCEPYLRRTFKGSTDELRTVVAESLAGKRKPPDPDEKEPPGYGPPVTKKCGTQAGRHFALFAVIPSFVLVGPLALVAALVPGAFARLAVGMRRWRAFLAVASFNTAAAFVYWALREFRVLPELSAVSPLAFGLLLLGVDSAGLVWAGCRYRRPEAGNPPPGRGELVALLGLTAASGLMVVGVAVFLGLGEALSPAGTRTAAGQPATGMGKEFTAVAVGLLAATLYAGYRAVAVQPRLSGETVALAAVVLFGVISLVLTWPREKVSPVEEAGGPGPQLVDVRVWFETADYDEVLSSVTVAGDRVYFGVGKQSGLRSSGAVVCLERATGRELWRFDDGGAMKPVFATPAVEGGHVFTGEGLHTDVERRLFRLDAATGTPSWPAPVATTGHTEGSPRVVGDRVYFSAGGDGLYCANASTGATVWHFRGDEQKLHIDTPPAISDGRVFVGSGYRTLALLGLDARTGAELWRTPVRLRSFGPPLVLGDRVVYGLGTGNLLEDLATEPDGPPERSPAGVVVCVEAATGKEVWRYDTPKSVHTAPTADGRTVYAACQDGSVFALDRHSGELRWRRPLGSALTAGPVATPRAVYAVTRKGLVACLDPTDGGVYWTCDLSAQTRREVQVLSTPVVQSSGDGTKRKLLFGAMLTSRNTGAKSAAVFRIEDSVDLKY
jgi:outer membrane protein assembly factor BamB